MRTRLVAAVLALGLLSVSLAVLCRATAIALPTINEPVAPSETTFDRVLFYLGNCAQRAYQGPLDPPSGP